MKKDKWPENEHEKNYMSLGMAYGLCGGALIGALLISPLGILPLPFCLLGGMFVGMLIGMQIKKNEVD